MTRLLTAFFALLLPLPLLAQGFGLGEGQRDPAPPVAPRPAPQPKSRYGLVHGTVSFAPGWRKLLSSDGAAQFPSKMPRRTGAFDDWERKALSSLIVTASGGPTRASTAVQTDGTFALRPLREGRYQLLLESGGHHLITSAPMTVDRRARANVSIELAGPDLPDLDEDGDRREPLARLVVVYKAPSIEYTRVYEPGGLVRTTFAEGTLELGAPGEPIRVFNADGTREERPAQGQARQRERPALIEASMKTVVDPASAGAGLLSWQAAVDLEGGGPNVRLLASAYGLEGGKRLFELRDDGSAEDLDPATKGHQGSGDREAGDGNFAMLTPVDSRDGRMLYNGVVVLTALGETGGAGASTALFIYGPPRERADGSDSGLASKLRVVELVSRDGGLAASLEFGKRPSMPLHGALFGPDGQEAPWIAEPGGLRFTSSVITGKLDGYTWIAVATPDGVYHSGARLEGVPSKPRRLDG